MYTEKIEYLNKHNAGTFRALNKLEKAQAEVYCNKENGDSEWIQPYAVREQTHDFVCTYDSAHSTSNALFVSYPAGLLK